MTRTGPHALARTGGSLLAILALSLLAQGCAELMQHSPRTDLVDELGYEHACAELRLSLTRALAPPIQDVTIDPQSFTIHSMAHMYWAGLVTGRTVLFENIARVDVYDNARAFVIDVHQREQLTLDYATVDEALRLADLLLSFRTWAQGSGKDWPAAGPGPTAPSGGEQREQGAERRTEDVLGRE